MADNAAPARRAVLRFDVGKASRWACMLTRDGEVAANRPVASSEHELDRLFSQVGEGTLVVVDQVRNIGALPISRARGGRARRRLPARHGGAPGLQDVRRRRQDRRARRPRDRQDRHGPARRAAAGPGTRREPRGREAARLAARPHGDVRHEGQEPAAPHPLGIPPGARGPGGPLGPEVAARPRPPRRRLGRGGRGKGVILCAHAGRARTPGRR